MFDKFDKLMLLLRATMKGSVSREDLNDFFSKNVVIMSGDEKAHIHSLFIHEWAEGRQIEKYDTKTNAYNLDLNPSWAPEDKYRVVNTPVIEYRIKIKFIDIGRVGDSEALRVIDGQKITSVYYIDHYFTIDEFFKMKFPKEITLDESSGRIRQV